ncbi:unnamed protein product [Rotaria sordida]|uniref:Glycosyl hydrolase family 13 catalytic domain-containing protein n=1 Tax=Rotaria sordida TaxID=392033 RepID=A0A815AMI4_9BILA|nr:unnamed protein product [Rotaria sordida]
MCDRPFILANSDEIVDITAFNYGEKYFDKMIRDRQRTPMQWTSQEANAGFTSSTVKPFLPLSDTWHELNVEQQQNALRSHLKLFQQLVKLRQQAPFYGGYQKKVIATKELYAFIRWLDTNIYLIVININKKGHDPIINDFTKLLKCQNKELFGEVIARSCNILDDSLIGKEGNQINLNNLILQSSEAIVLKLLTYPSNILFCQQ